MSQVESSHVVTITEFQARVLEAARGLMARGIRPTEVSVARVLDVGGTTVRSHLASLRRSRLLPRWGDPDLPVTDDVTIVVLDSVNASRSTTSDGGRRVSSMAAIGPAARRAAAAEQAVFRERFEAAARDYEPVRLHAASCPIQWKIAHDRLLESLVAYVRLRGAEPCICDGIAYYPDSSGSEFVRNDHPPVCRGIR